MSAGFLRGALSPQAIQRQVDVLAAHVAAGGSVQDAAELVGTGLTSQVTGRGTSQVTTSDWNASTLVGDSMLEPQDLVV